MKHFTEIYLPTYDTLFAELNELLNSDKLSWGEQNQICLNSVLGFETDFHKGAGSLIYDWNNSKIETDNGVDNITNLFKKTEKFSESDFTVICSQFKGTTFETIYNILDQKYVLGRVRLMRLNPKKCLSWHTDDSLRLHFPLLTQEGCMMIIEDEVMHLSKNKWYMADTTKKHTAINSSKSSRIHLVAVILQIK